MKSQKNKLTLDAFKEKSSKRQSKSDLSVLTGGILGACHCETDKWSSGESTVCYYNKK